MTAEVLLYARGGGCGHAMRGAAIRRTLAAGGARVTLLVAAGSDRHLPADVERSHASFAEATRERRFGTLVVDTFPRGWEGELDARALARFERRVLISRYSTDAAFAAGAAAYDELWNPYPASLDEWSAPPPRSRPVGWLINDPPMRVVAGGRDFVLFDPGERVPEFLVTKLDAYARRHGLRLELLRRARRRVIAAKLLSIGAGYHTVYELAHAEADLRFFPLARRFDDQARRAALVGRSAASLRAVLDWLAAPVREEPFAPPVSERCVA